MYCVDTKELKKCMIDAGIETNAELSSKSGVNRNTIGDILNDKIYPSSDVMVKIVAALSLTSEKAGSIFFKKKLT